MDKLAACLILLVALAACDTSPGDAPADAATDVPTSPTCSGTLTGKVTETIVGCKITWTEQAGVADVGNEGHIDVSDESVVHNFGFTFRVNGDALTGSFSKSNVVAYFAGVDVVTPGDAGATPYLANYSVNPTGPPNVGSVSVSITSVLADYVDGSTSNWIVHGHAVATMVPPTGGPAAGTVEMSIDF